MKGYISKQTNGKELFRVVGYFTNFASCLKKVLAIKISRSQAKNLEDLLTHLLEIEKDLDKLKNVKVSG